MATVERLRIGLAQIDQRISAEIRPRPDGGADVFASFAGEHDALLRAYRAVATTGARPARTTAKIDQATAAHLRIAIAPSDDVPSDHLLVVGDVDDVRRCTPPGFTDDGDLIYWLGPRSDRAVTDNLLVHERKVAEVLVSASRDGLLNAALDVQTGGMAVTIGSMSLVHGVGARFWTPEEFESEEVPNALFDDSLGGVICAVPRTEELRFSDMCIARYLPAYRVGVVDGAMLEAQGHFRLPISDLRS